MAEDGYSEDGVYLFYHEAVVVYFKVRLYYFVVLFGCETMSVTFREEHWLRVFESAVLGRYLAREWRVLEETV